MDIGTVDFDFDLDTKRLIDSFYADNDLYAVIRSHFETERALIHGLRKLTGKSPKHISRNIQTFHKKCEGLETSGINPAFIRPLRLLNCHRNRFAHYDELEITNHQLLELQGSVRTISPTVNDDFLFRDRSIVDGHIRFEARYRDLSRRQKYVFNVGTAIAFFSGAIMQPNSVWQQGVGKPLAPPEDGIVRVEGIEVVVPSTLVIHWQKGGTNRVDLADWIETGGDAFDALGDVETFRAARIIADGAAVAWDDDGELAIDAHHLRMIAMAQAANGN